MSTDKNGEASVIFQRLSDKAWKHSVLPASLSCLNERVIVRWCFSPPPSDFCAAKQLLNPRPVETIGSGSAHCWAGPGSAGPCGSVLRGRARRVPLGAPGLSCGRAPERPRMMSSLHPSIPRSLPRSLPPRTEPAALRARGCCPHTLFSAGSPSRALQVFGLNMGATALASSLEMRDKLRNRCLLELLCLKRHL